MRHLPIALAAMAASLFALATAASHGL